MSEYNIQMNKYNALNAEYDQLYPQPMKHASTHAKDGDDPITPSSIGAAELGADGKVPAEQVDAYSQSDSISASTRTALGISETATPDAALAEIARQLSESVGFSMKMLWENASPSSAFPAQTIAVDYSEYQLLLFVCNDHAKSEYGAPSRIISGIVNVANEPSGVLRGTSTQPSKRNYSLQNNQIIFSGATVAQEYGTTTWGDAPNTLIPVRIYGIKGIA